MVANPDRRTAILDAAVDLLGADGGRALTYRNLDRRAGLPLGTTSNYFPTRADLVLAVARRVFERLTPSPARIAELAEGGAGTTAQVGYVQYVVERLLAAPRLTLALVELRLHAARDADLAAVLAPFLRDGLAADQAFHAEAGLPGTAGDVTLLHYAIEGLVLDRLTVPLDPGRPVEDIAAQLAVRLTGSRSEPRFAVDDTEEDRVGAGRGADETRRPP